MHQAKEKPPQATECRLAWKVIATGATSHGPWRKISDEPYVENTIEDLDRTNKDRVVHFIEYQ